MINLTTDRCPLCGGHLMHPPHPHAYGHKAYDIVVCRRKKRCGARYETGKLEAYFKKHVRRSTK